MKEQLTVNIASPHAPTRPPRVQKFSLLESLCPSKFYIRKTNSQPEKNCAAPHIVQHYEIVKQKRLPPGTC